MGDVNLKPCPFCGGSAEVSFRGKPENGGFFVVGCATCRASMVGGYYRGSSDELYKQPYPLSEMVGASKAIESWNRRANDALSLVLHLEVELAATKLERDAAVRDMCKMAISKFPCDVCSNDHQNDPVCKSHQGDCSVCSVHCPCDGCFDGWEMELTGRNFAWRGVCPENTEVSPDA